MEIFSSWALFIVIMLLIAALFTSYMLQQKKVEAIHETVISIFAGKLAGYCTDLSNFPRHDRRPYSQNQLWNFGNNFTLSSKAWTLGVAYRIPFKPHLSQQYVQ